MGRRKRRKLPAPAVVTSSPVPPPAPWIDLPDDLTANILQRLDPKEIFESAQIVCTTWRRVCKDPATWRVLDLNYRYYDSAHRKFETICRCAVDRSQGQLVELTVTAFGEDRLLNYVADRSSKLRRLTLVDYAIFGESFVEVMKKLPQLEELHLIGTIFIGPEDIEIIGISCPMLKSFTYNEPRRVTPDIFEDLWDYDNTIPNELGVVIGKTMPNLRCLRILDQRMNNKGLEAILDGCPHLKSLDLRQCSGLELQEWDCLGKRCSKQMKDLRLPSDSTIDLDWLTTNPFECDDVDWDELLSNSRMVDVFDFSYWKQNSDSDSDYD